MTAELPAPDLVLEHLEWVRRLARALVRDGDGADELVQDAWLRVHRSPPPAGRRDRAWLTRVLRNLARDRRRTETRREHREHAAARPEALKSDAELRASVERQETLARWVLELDQPYRRTMLLRWFEGHDPRRIAADEELPLATVRTRLSRGTAMLRERAARERASQGQAWLALVAGVPSSTSLIANTAETVSLATVLIMKWKLLAALLIVALVSWFVPRSRDGLEGDPLIAQDARGPESVLPDAVTRPEAAEATERRAIESVAATAASMPELDGLTDASELFVRVVDEADRPVVGAPVGVFEGSGSAEQALLQASTSAPMGEAVFSEIEARIDARGVQSRGKAYFVGLDMPGFDLARVPVEPAALPEEPVLLVAPAHARLELRFVDARGRPREVSSWAYATPLYVDPSEPGRLRRGERCSRRIEARAMAVFPMVQVGLPLRVELQDMGILRGGVRQIEPLQPGETRIVEFVLGALHAHVTGRVVDAVGQPIAARYLDVDFDPDGSARVYEVGDDGSFLLPLERLRGADGLFRGLIRAKLRRPGGAQHEVERLSGSFEASVPPQGGSVDVGEVVMRAAPAVASGRVVDANGLPVHPAFVSVYEKFNQREDLEDFGWNFAGLDYAHTDEDGEFVVQGDVPPGEYAIRAHGQGWVDRGAQRFQSGMRGLELVLDRSRFIAGRVVLPAGVRPEAFRIRAFDLDATREQSAYVNWKADVLPDGRFLLSGLRSGPVSLALRRDGADAVVAALEDLEPVPDAADVDARLDPWDLRDALVHVSFDVHLQDGSLATRGLVALGDRVVAMERGHCEALLRVDGDEDLLVVAPGHKPVRFPPRAAPARVDLVRGLPVVVGLAQALPPVPDGWIVELELNAESLEWIPAGGFLNAAGTRRAGFGTQWTEQVRVRPGETEWELHVSSPGRYRPRWTIRQPADDPVLDGSRSGTFTTRSGRYELVVESAKLKTSRFHVEVDPAAVEACIEAMR